MLDLSAIAPAARYEVGRDAIYYLYDLLSRIELPPWYEIPDASAYADLQGDEETGARRFASWRIPNTEIMLERVIEGPRAGDFLFSSSTVARAREFYDKVSGLPYRREVPLPDHPQMRPYLSMGGWLIPSSIIEAMPEWLKHSVYQHAVWKWIALLMLIVLGLALVRVIHRRARRGLYGQSPAVYLRRLVTPLTLLLLPLALYLANRQMTLTGWVSGGVTLLAEAVTYFALAWIVERLDSRFRSGNLFTEDSRSESGRTVAPPRWYIGPDSHRPAHQQSFGGATLQPFRGPGYRWPGYCAFRPAEPGEHPRGDDAVC
jgi:MscS family membrane protein